MNFTKFKGIIPLILIIFSIIPGCLNEEKTTSDKKESDQIIAEFIEYFNDGNYSKGYQMIINSNGEFIFEIIEYSSTLEAELQNEYGNGSEFSIEYQIIDKFSTMETNDEAKFEKIHYSLDLKIEWEYPIWGLVYLEADLIIANFTNPDSIGIYISDVSEISSIMKFITDIPIEDETEHKENETLPNDELHLELIMNNTIYIDKKPGYNPNQTIEVPLNLKVSWNGTGKWTGKFANSQKYNFTVYKDNMTIWDWAYGLAFFQAVIPFGLNPGSSVLYEVTWPIDISNIEEGDYIVEALFMATYQTTEKVVEIRFIKW